MMQYLTPKKSVKAISDAQKRSDFAQAVAELMFVKAAQAQQLDDAFIAKYPEFFVTWDENWRGKAGDIVQDEGKLYRSIHDVTDAGQNRKPSENPSMWTRIRNPLEEFPEWIQPLGAVSYTHLDVYKRQRSHRCHTNPRGGTGWKRSNYSTLKSRPALAPIPSTRA